MDNNGASWGIGMGRERLGRLKGVVEDFAEKPRDTQSSERGVVVKGVAHGGEAIMYSFFLGRKSRGLQ